MDHTVYERKNTDLGSTSMTKSGGFSIKKRHRKLGALIGLAALAVPFAANLGTLGDAIHAVTGPQNVYESELLNVKLKTSQDKTKTTWDLEFDRSDMSVSEQTVKFKLDLEKAGLKDAEIKQDDKTLDMREGIVDAVLKSQSTHLILTAISTNEDKHDITLPVTELGLYDEQNGENRLEVDNRSVDLTMVFEQVAKEEIKEASSEENQAEKKDVKAFPDDGNDSHLTYDPTVKADQLGALDVTDTVTIGQDHRTSTNAEATNTNPRGFQYYTNVTSSKQYEVNSTNNNNFPTPTENLAIWKKFNRTAATIDSVSTAGGLTHQNTLRNYYYNKYGTQNGTNNLSSYLFEFKDFNQTTLNGAQISVTYDNVGTYYTGSTPNQMGAIMTISNIKTRNDNRFSSYLDPIQHPIIDVPNKLAAGVLYQGIDSLDIELRFFAVDVNGNFTKELNIINPADEVATQVTFGSLNNHTNVANPENFRTDQYGKAQQAETVGMLNASGNVDWSIKAIVDDSGNMQQATGDSQSGGRGKIWYSRTLGDYTNTSDPHRYTTGTTYADPYAWVDWLRADTYPRGAVSYEVSGQKFGFRFYTGSGNTWQSINMARLTAAPLTNPVKSVTTETTYNGALTDLNASVGGLHGNLDNESVSQLPTVTEGDGKNYFEYNYWVFQPTYVIGDEGLLKPKQIVMTDELPFGTTLVNGTAADIKVYPTPTATTPNPSALTLDDDYKVTISTDPTTKRQTVAVTINSDTAKFGMDKITFNGNNIAWSMNVKVDADSANADPVLGTPIDANDKDAGVKWVNTAKVKAVNTEKATNSVLTKLRPFEGNLKLDVKKTDAAGADLTGATFTLSRKTTYNDWNGSTYTTTGATTENPAVEVEGKLDGADVVFGDDSVTDLKDMDLKPGVYTLSESAPSGWSGIANTELIINYVRVTPGEDKTDPDYDNIKMTVTYTNSSITSSDITGTGGVQLKVKNTQVGGELLLEKVDGDGEALAGATFTIQEFKNGVGGTTYPLTVSADGTTFSLPSELSTLTYSRNNETAEVYYKVTETGAPSGYAQDDPDTYFALVSKSDMPASQPSTTASDVYMYRTDEQGNVTGNPVGLTLKEGKYLVQFEISNYAKSIFPRVGGTGIQAYIGAGLIVMLIAGGAAWYIKRRQNQ